MFLCNTTSICHCTYNMRYFCIVDRVVDIILDFNKYRIIQPTNNVVHFLDMVHDDRKHLHGT